MTEAEFANLVEDIRPELVRIAARRCGRDQAEDAVQKGVLRLWESRQWVTADRHTVAGWLRHKAVSRGQDEMKSLLRLRAAQRNIRVLSDKGHKQTARQPNSDGEGY